MEAIYLLLLLCAWATAQQTCPQGFQPHHNSCYRISRMEVGWPEAYVYCDSIGSHLLAIETAGEQQAVAAMIKSYGDHVQQPGLYWLDGNDLREDSKYYWLTTSAMVQYTNWHTGEPNNFNGLEHCMAIYSNTYTWNDWDCAFKLAFICETSPGTSSG